MKSSSNETNHIGCVLMASGFSNRFGSNKLLTDFHGKPLFSHVLNTLIHSSVSKICIVTRYSEIAEYCEQFHTKKLYCVLHKLPYRSDTIRLGLKTLQDADPDLEACMFCQGDQPLLSTESVNNIVSSYVADTNTSAIYRLSYQGHLGSPVLFSHHFFSELATLSAKKGGNYIIQKHAELVIPIEAKTEAELLDIDRPEDKKKIADL